MVRQKEHAITSFTAHSESKQALDLRAVTLRPPWEQEARAVRGAQSKHGLRPSIDPTFYSELYLNLTSPLGIRPIFNKTEDKVVCVRKMQASGNIISDPPWPPARRELSCPEFLMNLCMVCRGCSISYSFLNSTHCHCTNKGTSKTLSPPPWLLPSSNVASQVHPYTLAAWQDQCSINIWWLNEFMDE